MNAFLNSATGNCHFDIQYCVLHNVSAPTGYSSVTVSTSRTRRYSVSAADLRMLAVDISIVLYF